MGKKVHRFICLFRVLAFFPELRVGVSDRMAHMGEVAARSLVRPGPGRVRGLPAASSRRRKNHHHQLRHHQRENRGRTSWENTWRSLQHVACRCSGEERRKTEEGASEDVDDDVELLLDQSDVLSSLICRSSVEGHATGTLSPISYAFLGDVVWELYARTKHLLPPSRVAHYRKETEKSVMAEYQAECLDRLTGEEAFLSEVELLMVKRGRNSNTPTVPKRLRSSTDSKQVYAKATALECLVGYLYLTNPARLREVMEVLGMTTSEKIKLKGEARLDDTDGLVPVAQRSKPERTPEITVKKRQRSPPKGFGKT